VKVCATSSFEFPDVLTFLVQVHRPVFRCAVIMFQEEFALRLSARELSTSSPLAA
jgi:16S rRNA A1518/A1519 N6-dimethyltransferase RsmA/KsgA/DIM1 with predicted DNA glycosylase/AP lyase activity